MRRVRFGALDTRRLTGVAVLAAAVLVLAVVAGLGRPQVAGVANAPPIDPPPQVGDCLYGGPDGPWGRQRSDGSWENMAYQRWYGPCREPWFGEVVGVRTEASIQADLAAARVGSGVDPCMALVASYLGQPVVEPVPGWSPVAVSASGLEPNRRQFLSGPMWQACVLTPPPWTAAGTPMESDGTSPWTWPTTTEPMRGRWDDPAVRNRFGQCETGTRGESRPVFCGAPHDRELVAWTSWESPTDAASLPPGCALQTARVMGRQDPTAGHALAQDVITHDPDGRVAPVAAGTVLEPQGFAECWVRPADPRQQLTATVAGLGEGPVPLA